MFSCHAPTCRAERQVGKLTGGGHSAHRHEHGLVGLEPGIYHRRKQANGPVVVVLVHAGSERSGGISSKADASMASRRPLRRSVRRPRRSRSHTCTTPHCPTVVRLVIHRRVGLSFYQGTARCAPSYKHCKRNIVCVDIGAIGCQRILYAKLI